MIPPCWRMKRAWTSKEVLAAAALLMAGVLALWGMLLPPAGDIENNMLVLIAQFLVFAATLLGVGGKMKKGLEP